ncbi:LacI family DNA-binding transcriptional regulator [Clostridium saccharoperbutylacetonicum]|uniref:LacI family DNA-binding transcriptional regulator n=1 Tax=Clostridium saccharoperbutylacetonicum TaxID=36745 RepID=UPI000983BD17|nr:LacI family DNA-binding transcriptional regulator [Clostridium saccharoperbutylacetonicum]AQR97434.1 catabolite control protein A [Clostridium saccharoperbutylacetonicum]NSB33318.1 LacI family transcriptional regulator [Clostridium saccharoperbutylacetonicum]
MNNNIKRPTIKDVAKKSNVSVATVSRIINNLDGYSEETRKKVIEVMDELGYQRNAIARNLKVKETRTIGVLRPKISTTYYVEILNGIEDFAQRNNYSVIICNGGDKWERMSEYLQVLSERQVDGLIVCSIPPDDTLCKRIIDSHIPTVLVSGLSYKYSLPYVKVDDYQASYSATTYLIENGHKEIAIISGPTEDPIAGVPRLNGFLQALRDNNIPVKKNLIKEKGFSFIDGVEGMNELLKTGEKFTAVFAVSDDCAVGALSVAHKNGLKVPDDISIIGYDNTNIAEMSYPPLTTVAQPLYDMGKKSVEMLIKRISYNEKVESIIMPFEIIERETVKKIKDI